MPYQTHGLRHDTNHLFAKLLSEDKWLMTPCVVIAARHQWPPVTQIPWPTVPEIRVEISMARSGAELVALPDDAQVICPWPGAKRQDVFEFTVGQFRAYMARSSSPKEATMTCVDEKCIDDPKPDAEVGATEENVNPDAAESDAAAEEKPEGECAEKCAEPCEGSGDAPAAQPAEEAPA